ncbi:MAG: amidohydrolase family protein [Chloroflexi bacterium]|nr:amidohydrolase family protein [Chloroflexota bacterium]
MRDAPPRRYIRVGRVFCATGPTVPRDGQTVEEIGAVADGEVIDDAVVQVVGTRIGAVGPADRMTIPSGAEVIDLPGTTLVPGLVDAHVHMMIRQRETFTDLCRTHDDSQLLVRSAAHARQMRDAGVTTARDCGSRGTFLQALRDGIADGLVPGPRLLVCGPPITSTGGHLWSCGGEVDTADEARTLSRRLIRDGVDFIKVMATGGRMTPGTNVGRAQFSEAELRAIVDDAHRLGRPVAAHVLGTEGMAHAVRRGCYRNMATQPSRVLAERPKSTPLGANERRDMADHQERWHWFRRGLELGIPSFFSTDAIFGQWEDACPDLAWLTIFVAERGGIPVPLALRMVTSVASAALGLGHEIGTVAPGRIADLLVVRGDPVSDPRALRDVAAVFQSGERTV